jgi:hypothetical protein
MLVNKSINNGFYFSWLKIFLYFCIAKRNWSRSSVG